MEQPRAALTFQQAVQKALYEPKVGYYQQNKQRVGKAEGTDFYTASCLSEAWVPCILQGAATFLGEEQAQQLDFIELGAEPEQKPWQTDLFASTQQRKLGDPLIFEKPCCLFANELLDAQPFRQYRFIHDQWVEWGVQCINGQYQEAPLNHLCADSLVYHQRLPQSSTPGYTIDMPTGAEHLLAQIAAQPAVKGLLFIDYGKTWAQISEEHPQGTARAYYQHMQTNRLWENFGHQDITHHVIWDFLKNVLIDAGFQQVQVLKQSTFLIQYAQSAIQHLLQSHPDPMSKPRRALQALIQPVHFGDKFQVLLAKRPGGYKID